MNKKRLLIALMFTAVISVLLYFWLFPENAQNDIHESPAPAQEISENKDRVRLNQGSITTAQASSKALPPVIPEVIKKTDTKNKQQYNGRVVNESGEGVPGCKVTVSYASRDRAGSLYFSEALTGSNKVVEEIDDLLRGEPKTVKVQNRYQAFTDAAGRFFLEIKPINSNLKPVLKIEKTGYFFKPIVIAIPRDHDFGTHTIYFSGSISGTVFERTGQPFKRAVLLLLRNTDYQAYLKEKALLADEFPYSITDNSSAFKFQNVRAGTYYLLCKSEKQREAVIPIEVRPGDKCSQDIELKGGRSLKIIVRDETGKAIEGCNVEISGMDPWFLYDKLEEMEAKSNATGECNFPGLLFHKFRTRISAAKRGTVQQTIFLNLNQEKTEVSVTLYPECSVTGRVLKADGQGAEGYIVELFPVEDSGEASYYSLDSIECDENGLFRLDQLNPGRYKLAVSIDGTKIDRPGVGDLFKDLILRPEDRKYQVEDMHLPRDCQVKVTITRHSGEPCVGHLISAVALNGYLYLSPSKQISDKNGQLTLKRLSPGDYAFIVYNENHSELVQTVSIPDQKESELLLVLPEKTGAVQTEILNPKGQAVKAGVLWLSRTKNRGIIEFGEDLIHTKGRVLLKHIPPGTFILNYRYLDKGRGDLVLGKVDVLGGETTKVRFTLPQMTD